MNSTTNLFYNKSILQQNRCAIKSNLAAAAAIRDKFEYRSARLHPLDKIVLIATSTTAATRTTTTHILPPILTLNVHTTSHLLHPSYFPKLRDTRL